MSGAADHAKGLYDREYARDLLSRGPWGDWGSGGSGSDGGGSSGGGYGDSGSSNPCSTDTAQANDSSANPASQERNDSAQTSATSNEDAGNSDQETTAKQGMDRAVRAFQNGDYAEAQRECERVIRLLPGNANVQEFCALRQFAQGNYKDAAVTLRAVLAAGPGWDWKMLSSLYTNPQTYRKRARALEDYVRERPNDAAGRFVLAYHYLVLDEPAPPPPAICRWSSSSSPRTRCRPASCRRRGRRRWARSERRPTGRRKGVAEQFVRAVDEGHDLMSPYAPTFLSP